jgi:hypothetical protein
MSAILLLAAVLAADPAVVPPAAPPAAAPPPLLVSPPPAAVGWYGQPSAIIDGLSIAAIIGGLSASGRQDSNGGFWGILAVGGLVGFELGGPAVHMRNGHYGRAAASVGMRLVGAAMSGYLGLRRSFKCDPETAPDYSGCQSFTASEMLLVGFPLVFTAAIDDILMSSGPIPPRASSEATSPAPTIAPMVGPGGAGLSFAGSF